MLPYKNNIESEESNPIQPLENDFKIYKNLKHIPLSSHPSYTQKGMVFFCTKGSAKISIYTNAHTINKNELVVIFPGQLVSLTEVSHDFMTSCFTLSQSFFEDTLSGICRFSPHFFFYIRSNFFYQLSGNNIQLFTNYFLLLYNRATSPSNLYRKESVMHLLRILYLDVYNSYQNNIPPQSHRIDTRKKALANAFFNLIMEHYKNNREVAFYADKLCITPKYLSAVIKNVSGKSAKDWITEYIILEIKGLLKNTTLNIQEIVSKTNFANQSSLGRFFRQHTGMSPLQYRTRK